MRWLPVAALSAVALALVPAASPAAKPIENTQFALATSQGQVGTLFYFRDHEIEGRRYLFAQIQVILICGSGSTTTETFFLDGNLRKRDNDRRFEIIESTGPLPGDSSIKRMNVRLLPKPKKGKTRVRPVWKRAVGSLSFDLSSQSSSGEVSQCSSGPVRFDTAIVTRF
jgi:hypothetical protein